MNEHLEKGQDARIAVYRVVDRGNVLATLSDYKDAEAFCRISTEDGEFEIHKVWLLKDVVAKMFFGSV